MKTITILLFISVLFVSSAALEKIHFLFAQDYPPFSWESDTGAAGILIDFVHVLVEESLGIDVEYEIYPWARCQMMVKEGQADAIFTIPTPTREEFCHISKTPAFESNYVMWTGFNNPKMKTISTITSLEELAEHTDLIHIHILGGGWHITHLKPMKKVVTKANSTDILRILAINRADVYIEQEALMRFQMRQHGYIDSISVIPNTIDITAWHIMVGKNSKHTAIIDALDAILTEMKKNGELLKLQEQIYSRYR